VLQTFLKVMQKVENKWKGQACEERCRGRLTGVSSEETEVKVNNREKRIFVV
jgi:hypothetical protein